MLIIENERVSKIIISQKGSFHTTIKVFIPVLTVTQSF